MSYGLWIENNEYPISISPLLRGDKGVCKRISKPELLSGVRQ